MEPLPDLSTTITVAVIVAVFLFSYAFLRISNTPQKKQPPEAGGALPLIGHLHRLRTREPSHITLAKMAEKYGPIFTLRMGMKKALIISDWEIARECFTTHDRIFATRPKLIAIELMGYNYSMMGFSPYGPYWRHIRKIVTLELLSNRRLELLQHIRISEIQNSVKELYDLCVNKGENKVKFEMKKWFEDVTLNTTFRIVLGKRFFDAFEGLGNEGEDCRKAMKDFFELFGRFVVSDSLPFLKWLDLGGYQKAMKKTAEKLDKVFDKWLKEHQQRRNSDHYKEMTQNDFMDVMLSLVQDDDFQFSSYDAHTIIKATCLAMILGGSETTAVTMTWALSLLLNNQEAMKKAQLELEEQVGRERQVKESDVKNLVYLRAIVKETMRLYPAGPLSAPHESMEECVVGGYHIDIGTRLIVNLQKLQRDPLVWEDPCEFRPERFLDKEREDFDVRGQTPQLIPFGSGRRICPGISFALQLVHLTLANLIHGFEIGKVLDEPINMEETIGLNSVKKTPLEVVLIPRLPSHIYG